MIAKEIEAIFAGQDVGHGEVDADSSLQDSSVKSGQRAAHGGIFKIAKTMCVCKTQKRAPG
jgi:hypothetical protein